MPLPLEPYGANWVVNGFGMFTDAMASTNLELLYTPADLDIDNLDLAGVDGNVPLEVFEVESTHQIRMQMCGDVLHNGTTAASIRVGVAANYAAVCAALHKSTWGGPTCATTVTRPDGVDLAGDVQVRVGPLGEGSGGIVHFNVTVTIPAGALTVVTP